MCNFYGGLLGQGSFEKETCSLKGLPWLKPKINKELTLSRLVAGGQWLGLNLHDVERQAERDPGVPGRAPVHQLLRILREPRVARLLLQVLERENPQRGDAHTGDQVSSVQRRKMCA